MTLVDIEDERFWQILSDVAYIGQHQEARISEELGRIKAYVMTILEV
jgi:hypothetical protein